MLPAIGTLAAGISLYILLFLILRNAHRNNTLNIPGMIDGWIHTPSMIVSKEKQPNFYAGVLAIYAGTFALFTLFLLYMFYLVVFNP